MKRKKTIICIMICAFALQFGQSVIAHATVQYTVNDEKLPEVTTLILCATSPEDALGSGEKISEFIKLTKLDELMLELEAGAVIERVFYDHCLYSPFLQDGETKFTTTDPVEIAALWEAIQKIEIRDKGMFLTDWYPTISFCTDYGNVYSLRFDHKMLYISASECNNLENDREFLNLIEKLYSKYRSYDAITERVD